MEIVLAGAPVEGRPRVGANDRREIVQAESVRGGLVGPALICSQALGNIRRERHDRTQQPVWILPAGDHQALFVDQQTSRTRADAAARVIHHLLECSHSGAALHHPDHSTIATPNGRGAEQRRLAVRQGDCHAADE